MARKQADNECVANLRRERARDPQIDRIHFGFCSLARCVNFCLFFLASQVAARRLTIITIFERLESITLPNCSWAID